MSVQFASADMATEINARDPRLGSVLALLLSSQAVLVVVYDLAGIQGSSIFTGGLLFALTASIALLSDRFVARPADYLFGILVLCALASFALNQRDAPPKEIAALALSLASYPACRRISASRLDGAFSVFVWITAAIAAIGAGASLLALGAQWNDPHGKPFVFGFDGAAVYFLTALGFLVISLVSRPLTASTTALIALPVFLSAAVFSAALVRFTFAALVLTLIVAAARASLSQRNYIGVIVLVIVAGAGAGQIARHHKAVIMASYLIEQTADRPSIDNAQVPASAPSCSMDVNLTNSFAIRKAMLRDAVYLIPSAGLIGLGLDSFMRFSCIKATEVHNSILQATIEFGWLGGLALAMLVAVSLWRLARHRPHAGFVLHGLLFVALVSMAHGRLSRDAVLFAFLGLAQGDDR